MLSSTTWPRSDESRTGAPRMSVARTSGLVLPTSTGRKRSRTVQPSATSTPSAATTAATIVHCRRLLCVILRLLLNLSLKGTCVPRVALSLALRAGPSPETTWGRDGGSLRSRHFDRGQSSADARLADGGGCGKEDQGATRGPRRVPHPCLDGCTPARPRGATARGAKPRLRVAPRPFAWTRQPPSPSPCPWDQRTGSRFGAGGAPGATAMPRRGVGWATWPTA